MGHSIGDGIIVAAVAAFAFGYFYLKYRTKQRRLEIIHQERLLAMEKQIPLPELPLDPPEVYRPPNPQIPLILGIVLLTFGAGVMISLSQALATEVHRYWIMPLPLALMGLGLVLFYFLASRHER